MCIDSRPDLILRFVRKHAGDRCALCSCPLLNSSEAGYRVLLAGQSQDEDRRWQPVCERCVEYQAPELIPAAAAANALWDVLDERRRAVAAERRRTEGVEEDLFPL
jgi:hypothetical protein